MDLLAPSPTLRLQGKAFSLRATVVGHQDSAKGSLQIATGRTGRLDHPLIPVNVMPCTKYFWATKKSSTIGSVISIAAAIISS